MDIVLTSNSPGEVATWLVPAVRALRRRAPEAFITVCIPPCTFASGAEQSIVERLPEVDCVLGPKQFLQFMLAGRRPAGWRPGPRGAVCFLGGDMLYGVWLARRLKYPAVAYSEGRVRWEKVYERFFVPDGAAAERACREGARTEQVIVIGDLMADAVQPYSGSRRAARELIGVPDETLILAFFPGSRPFEVRAMVPFFTCLAEIVVRTAGKPLRAVFSLAPFVREDDLRRAASYVPPGIEGATAVLEPLAAPAVPGKARAWRLVADKAEAVVYQGLQYDIMAAADLAVTVPGSNTAEMAVLGLPMVVAVPLNRPQDIPLEGVAGLAGRLPVVGRWWKRVLVQQLLPKVRFTALPNRKANAEVVPEVRGDLQPADLAIPVTELLESPERRQALSRRLQELMDTRGAAGRLADGLLEVAGR